MNECKISGVVSNIYPSQDGTNAPSKIILKCNFPEAKYEQSITVLFWSKSLITDIAVNDNICVYINIIAVGKPYPKKDGTVAENRFTQFTCYAVEKNNSDSEYDKRQSIINKTKNNKEETFEIDEEIPF